MRKPGLEPGRVSPLDPKSSASTNSATSAVFYRGLTTLSWLCSRYLGPLFLAAPSSYSFSRDGAPRSRARPRASLPDVLCIVRRCPRSAKAPRPSRFRAARRQRCSASQLIEMSYPATPRETDRGSEREGRAHLVEYRVLRPRRLRQRFRSRVGASQSERANGASF
jgi:hypothetical protein